MNKLFFGKISRKYPSQLEDNYYGGGAPGSSWYGGLEVGDYVLPIYQGEISKLWRVAAFEANTKQGNPDGMVRFDLVKTLDSPVVLSSDFLRYRYFDLDLNLLNKSVKSTASEKVGFFPIATTDDCPLPEAIDFSDTRNIYIAFEKTFQPLPELREGDIRILISDREKLDIGSIQALRDGVWQRYDVLADLYSAKNATDERYGLRELLDFSEMDHASKKEKYLRAVIENLESEGYFTVISPVRLYDNILVGRKKTARKATPSTAKGGEIGGLGHGVEISKEDLDVYQEYVDLLKFNPNLILHGPPGTGKTYSVEKIIEAFEFDRTHEAANFQELNEAGRVRFVTFHQSFSYEEFVEGLRPAISDQEGQVSNDGNQNLQYRIQPGILMQLANQAVISQIQKEFPEEEFKKVGESSTIWKISLGSRGKEENIYRNCIKTKTIAVGWLSGQNLKGWDKEKIYQALKKEENTWSSNPTNDADTMDKFVNEMQVGDIVLVFASVTSIRAIGLITEDYDWQADSEDQYNHRRSVKWLRTFEKPIDILAYNGGKRLTMKTVYELNRLKFSDIKEMLEIDSRSVFKKDDQAAKPYFLVIDEINRGNISKIFGELITLLEKDKRDKIRIQLPYSQKTFSMPSNIYVIGTMNTADRSIAILDTALRRRFVFKELSPDPNLIRKDPPLDVKEVNLAALLEQLNEKITNKLDRDHQIGHSYFLEAFNIQRFKLIWYYQILPLLLEYFYNDGEAIVAIVGSAFVDAKTCQVKWIDKNEDFKKALQNILN